MAPVQAAQRSEVFQRDKMMPPAKARGQWLTKP